MQGGLAVLSGVAGLLAAWLTSDWRWTLGALLMLANWPYTIFGILPLNARLKAIAPEDAGPASRAMLNRWLRLHSVRGALSLCATFAFLWAAAG